MDKMTWTWTGKPATLADIQGCVGPGWSDILARLVPDLFTLGWDGNVTQVKEKFGGLRFYIGGGSDEVHDRIELACKESYRTCEECGEPGKPDHTRGWIRTLCPAHMEAKP